VRILKQSSYKSWWAHTSRLEGFINLERSLMDNKTKLPSNTFKLPVNNNKLRLQVSGSPPKVSPDRRLIDTVRNYVRGYKQTNCKCTDCKRQWPYFVLEFDHRDPKLKKFDIGNASAVPSMKALVAEIAKCDVVCSGCHKVREKRRGRSH
jgi:hypothetical protein